MRDSSELICTICGEEFGYDEQDQYQQHQRTHLQDYLGAACNGKSDGEERSSQPNNPTPDVDVSRLSDGRYALNGRNAAEAIIAPEEDWTVIGT